MIQMAILGLAIICVLAAASTLISGKIKLSGKTEIQGSAARGVGIGLLVLAAVMAAFALFILPHLR